MIKKILSFLVILNLIGGNAIAQTFNINDFKKVPLPIRGSEELYKLNNRPDQAFEVAIVKGELQITKSIYSPTIAYTLPEGKLLGINQGEGGGGLYYKPNDTAQKQLYVNGQLRPSNTKGDPFAGGLMIPRSNPIHNLIKNTILIKTGNINKIFTYRDSLYTMEGLAIMGLSYGAINKLQIKGDSVKGSLVLKFDDSPVQLDIYRDIMYIATVTRFYLIHEWQKELLFDNLFWSYLYPNSIAIKDQQHIYIGMRGGYALIDAKNKTLSFYQYKDDKQ